ncbi:glycosyltransferase [Halostella pelagica]|uniref:glycosyltransferase n=1 Tax=Halostella pelagica TaxID=2583824 RepID=UPI001081F622|nr:glycosyltransferase family 2 protein [Halostella pelagica]
MNSPTDQFGERLTETTLFVLTVLAFGLLLHLLPPPVVDICLLIGVLGFLYHVFLTYYEDRATGLPWPVSEVPVWCVFALPLGGTISAYVFAMNRSIIQTVVFSALLVVFFYFWFILPAAWFQKTHGGPANEDREPPDSTLSVLVPAYNEEGYVGRCVESLLDSRYPGPTEIIVIDDGSTDGTYDEAIAHATGDVTVIQQPNEGKYSALNTGLERSTGDVIVTVDADSVVDEDALVQIVRDLEADPNIGAVAGAVKLLRVQSRIEKLQALEYALGINTFRRAFAALGFVNVVPGCLGCFRRAALEEVGGYDGDTMTEDFDVTIKLLKAGWNVEASDSLAFTEAPRTWTGLYSQRLRWSRGNIETLVKHNDLLRSREVNNFTGLLFPYQIVSLVAMPFATVVILWTIGSRLAAGNIAYVVAILVTFTLLQLIASLFALALDENDLWLSLYAPVVVVVYKHFIDAVTLKSLFDIVRRSDRAWSQTRHRETGVSGDPSAVQKTESPTVETDND